MTEEIVVVGAALYDGGRLLAARRSAPAELAGGWELPGGKVEAGESPEEALVRELREELGVETEVLERIPGLWPLKPGYVLQVWAARPLPGQPRPRPLEDHDALRWLGAEEVWTVDWLVQDRPAVTEAARRLPASPPAGPVAGSAAEPLAEPLAGPTARPAAGPPAEPPAGPPAGPAT